MSTESNGNKETKKIDNTKLQCQHCHKQVKISATLLETERGALPWNLLLHSSPSSTSFLTIGTKEGANTALSDIGYERTQYQKEIEIEKTEIEKQKNMDKSWENEKDPDTEEDFVLVEGEANMSNSSSSPPTFLSQSERSSLDSLSTPFSSISSSSSSSSS